ncbi:MAG: hypothetical protein GC154_19685 [bacterium]|nr:hypothetical protein [bacterium]
MSDQNTESLTQHDLLEMWRCPQLGGPVTFNYCRRMNGGLPCYTLHRCWDARINVDRYLQENFSEEEIAQAMRKPENMRLQSIFDVIASVKKRQSGE